MNINYQLIFSRGQGYPPIVLSLLVPDFAEGGSGTTRREENRTSGCERFEQHVVFAISP